MDFQRAGGNDQHVVNVPVPLPDYITEVVSATADGANVNMGYILEG